MESSQFWAAMFCLVALTIGKEYAKPDCLDASGQNLCLSPDDDSFLYTMGASVRSLGMNGNFSIIFSLEESPDFSGVSYNIREHILYVTLEEKGAILAVNENGSISSFENIGRPTKIAVEWVSGNVYIVDNTTGARSIRMCDMHLSFCVLLQRLPDDGQVTALAVDPIEKYMFYCVNGEHEGVVWAASLTGNDDTAIGNFQSCTGLAIDPNKHRLYVAGVELVEMDYNGTRMWTKPLDHDAEGLAMVNDYLYYVTKTLVVRCSTLGRDIMCKTYIKDINSDQELAEKTEQEEHKLTMELAVMVQAILLGAIAIIILVVLVARRKRNARDRSARAALMMDYELQPVNQVEPHEQVIREVVERRTWRRAPEEDPAEVVVAEILAARPSPSTNSSA